MRPIRKYLLLLAVILLAGPALAANGNTKRVTVTASGMSRKEAVNNALRKAVEEAAGSFIYSRSQAEDFALVRDTVLSRAAGFVQEHRVVSASEMPDGTWEVRVNATVSVQGIEDTWGAVTSLLDQVGRPKVMVTIRETIDGRPTDQQTLLTEIQDRLLKSGFQLVVAEQIDELKRRQMEQAVIEDNPVKLQALARQFGAQLFITGTAAATRGEVKNVGGIRLVAYQAQGNVKTYRSDTAQLLASTSGRASRGVDRVWRTAADKALQLQAQHLAPRVTEDILRFWQDAVTGRGEVQLEVEGVSFRNYVKLKKDLQKLPHVKDITTRYNKPMANCSIQSDTNAETLAEQIITQFDNIEIIDVSQNVIKAKMAD
jgi:hypothetical protein